MNIVPVNTRTVRRSDRDLVGLIDEYVPELAPHTVLAVTSKIVALCEGRTVAPGDVHKAELVVRESERYIAPGESMHGVTLSIKGHRLIPTAGIDESNADGVLVLWPADPQATANMLRAHLAARSGGPVGVVITDSTTAPLRRGTTGVAVAASGFRLVRTYIGEQDLFGRVLEITRVDVADALAATAVLAMGEGAEGTPLAIIRDVPGLEFYDRDPTPGELDDQIVPPEEDLYWPVLRTAPWQTGGAARREERAPVNSRQD